MANLIPIVVADFETQIAAAIAVGDTSFTIASATDDDGNALPAGKYCFAVNNGSTNKQYLLGQLNGTGVTSVVHVTRQGTEVSGAQFPARAGSPVIISDFAALQRVVDILRGILAMDGSNPIYYDAEPTLADRKELATVGYVLDNVAGGTVTFGQQVVSAVAGESIVAGDLVYFNTADQEWYKTDADTAGTVEGVQLGIALGTGSNGVSISNGVQISGSYTTTGLTSGSLYYASNTAGAISTSAGTTSRIIGVALSTTRLLLIPINRQSIRDGEKNALVGGGNFGTPGASNKYITEAYNSSASGLPVVRTYLNAASPATWTKPTGLKYVVVEVQAAGGNGGNATGNPANGAAGGGGGYSKKLIAVASLGTTETVTIGAVGASSSFGSHCSANSGSNGANDSDTGAAGGTATGGDINVTGQQGNVSRGLLPLSGAGGDSMLGKGGSGVNADGTGNAGVGYGGGGSGGAANTATDRNGGAGAPAIVIVTEYYS